MVFFLASLGCSTDRYNVTFSSRQAPAVGSLFVVLLSNFISCTSSGLGGAICISSNISTAEIMKSAFTNCSSSANTTMGMRNFATGGAIAVCVEASIICNSCFYQCSGSFFGFVIFSSTSSSGLHQLNFTSIGNCGTPNKGLGAITMDYGRITIDQFNASFVQSNQVVTGIHPGTSAASVSMYRCQLAYVGGNSIFGVGIGVPNPLTQYCNFIDNTPSIGIIDDWPSSHKIVDCVFYNNTGSLVQSSFYVIYFYSCVSDDSISGSSVSCSDCVTNVANPSLVSIGSITLCDQFSREFTSSLGVKFVFHITIYSFLMLTELCEIEIIG